MYIPYRALHGKCVIMAFNAFELLRYEKVYSLCSLVSAGVETRSVVINFRIAGHLLASL